MRGACGVRGFVYVATCDGWANPIANPDSKSFKSKVDKVCKIGVSIDPAKRSLGLQAPAPVIMFKVWPSITMYEDEDRVFGQLREYRLHGEFFRLNGGQAAFKIDKILGANGTAEHVLDRIAANDELANPYADQMVRC